MIPVVALPSLSPWGPSKEESACCVAHVDSIGRFLPGWCSAECTRRPQKAGNGG